MLTTWIFLKNEGLKQLLKKCVQVKPLAYLTIALFAPFALAIVASIINSFVDKTSITLTGLLTSKEFPNFGLIPLIIYNLVFFGFGEEVGWRGFALPRIQSKLNALMASLVIAVLWTLWHLPLFFYRPGYTDMGIAGIFGWVFSILTGSILLTWLYNSSRASILICAIFHSTVDMAFTADLAGKNIVNDIGMLITVWGLLILIVFKSKNLSPREREKSAF